MSSFWVCFFVCFLGRVGGLFCFCNGVFWGVGGSLFFVGVFFTYINVF